MGSADRLLKVAKDILLRLELERKEKGPGAVFVNGANIEPLRQAIAEAELPTRVDELVEEYGPWGEHPAYSRQDWGYECGHRNTTLAYWDWVDHRMVCDEENDEDQEI